jgi:Leucine-rich repeat (LRR) protein
MNDIDGQERVRLRAREGEAVEWTRRVAQRAGTLKDMMDDAPTEDGVYPVPTIAAEELAVLREMCEADSMPARLEQCSISELFRLVEGASFLDAPGALNYAQLALASRLKGKRADELRELLGATDDFGSAEDRVAALAEPAFSPEGQLSGATVSSAGGAPALQPQPSLSGMAVTDDAKEAALGMVDVGTLAELKGVSQSWLALARRLLCSRLSRCEGQPAPTQLAEITDLNIKILVDAGRPWEAAAAGRMLPSLARLRWEGFEVNVAAVREVDLKMRRREFFSGRAKTALLSCIEGEGEPPLKLLLAAIACAGSGEIRGIPVQMMRDDSVSELDLQARHIGVEAGMLLAHLVPVMGALTSINLSDNQLCGERMDHQGLVHGTYTAEGVSAVCEAIQSNKETKLASLNFRRNRIGPVGAKSVAAMVAVAGGLTALDLSNNDLADEGVSAVCEAIQSNKETKLASLNVSDNGIRPVGAKSLAAMVAVTGGLTKLSLAKNQLGEEGTKAICEALKQNKTLKELDLSGYSISNIGGEAGAKHVADMLGVNGALTSINLSKNRLTNFGGDMTGIKELAAALGVNGGLTALNLSYNDLADEGVSAVCKAIQSNKETKLASLNFEYNFIGPVGANAVAAMVAVTGALTVTNLLRNQLDVESAKMLAEVAKQKGISLCGIQRDQTTADFSHQNLNPPDAILLASDLSQAVVTGALTVTNLLGNRLDAESAKMLAEVAKQKGISLCGIRRDQTIADFSNQYLKPPDVILLASDLSQAVVTGALTECDLKRYDFGEDGEASICNAVQGKAGFKLHL